jgi:hypothetical protein
MAPIGPGRGVPTQGPGAFAPRPAPSRRHTLPIASAIVCTLAVAASCPADQESLDLKGWATVRKGQVCLVAAPSLRKDAERYAVIASDALEYARSQWGVEMDLTTAMVCVPAAHEDFLATARGHEEDVEFAGGYATMVQYPTAAGVSVLQPRAVIDGSLPASFIPSALRHEMTHVAMFKAIGLKVVYVPLWFQQGVATYYQYGESETAKLAESYAGYAEGVPAFESIQDDTAHECPGSYMASIYAADLVGYSERTCGARWVGRILAQVKDGGAFEVAIDDASGRPLDELAGAWRADLQERADRRNRRNGIIAVVVVIGLIAVAVLLYWLSSRLSRRPPDDRVEPPQPRRDGIATIS